MKRKCFEVTFGFGEKIRLFFFILRHPWETLQTIDEFRKELEKLDAELVDLRFKLTNEMEKNAQLKIENVDLKYRRGSAEKQGV